MLPWPRERTLFNNNIWTHWGLSPGPSACEADVIPLHHVPHENDDWPNALRCQHSLQVWAQEPWHFNLATPTRRAASQTHRQTRSVDRAAGEEWHGLYGATVARLTPDQKVGSSNLSAVISCARLSARCERFLILKNQEQTPAHAKDRASKQKKEIRRQNKNSTWQRRFSSHENLTMSGR